MRALLAFALVSAVAFAEHTHRGPVKLTDDMHSLLGDADVGHTRYYPDWQYEGFKTKHEQQPAKRYHRQGTGPHDVLDMSKSTMNPHMANKSTPYPKNVLWLLNIFESGYGIPRSYNDILPNGDVYWATQTYLSVGAFNEYGNPTELDSMIGIQERTLTRFGLNLYDAATWMIALSLWQLHDVAYVYEENVLYTGTTGPGGTKNGGPGGLTNIRADNAGFQYGPQRVLGSDLPTIHYPGNVTHFPDAKKGGGGKAGKPTKKGPGSFFYRMIGPYYIMTDPMNGHYGNAWKFPWPNYDSTTSWNTFGEIHFNDWKPITGENVWGSMLGPIQSLGLKTDNNLTAQICGNEFRYPQVHCDWMKFDTIPPSIQLGMSILPALQALQDESGTLFHCPWGSKIFPPDPDEGANLSNENNFSGYASIDTFYWAVTNYSKGSSSSELKMALTAATRLRAGLKKWFKNPKILSATGQLPNSEQVVPQGGHLNSSGYHPVAIDTVGGLAMDCQTWGLAVMTRPEFDGLWGHGKAYKVWKTAVKYAGYYKGSVLAGIGYTDLANANGSVPVNDIWSAEWTFGAINMCQLVGQSYIDNGDVAMGQDMIADAQAMYDQVTLPWPDGLRFPDGSYVYANKRFFIPWGWFSNPISATCSTAWSVMMARNFDPFHYGGGNKPVLTTPPHMPSGMQ
jgi:hypothetical protein